MSIVEELSLTSINLSNSDPLSLNRHNYLHKDGAEIYNVVESETSNLQYPGFERVIPNVRFDELGYSPARYEMFVR